MHREVLTFLETMKRAYPEVFEIKRVLDCGSLDVNGSTRPFFKSATEYLGIDWRAGNGVDVVSLIHEYRDKPDGYFDVVISTETLEHDPFWRDSLRRMLELLKDDGTMILTMAYGKRAPHRLGFAPEEGYYHNLNLTEVLDWIAGLASFGIIHAETSWRDAYFFLGGKGARK